MSDKHMYVTPKLVRLGSVADLTQAGNSTPISRDFKQGSGTQTGPRNANANAV